MAYRVKWGIPTLVSTSHSQQGPLSGPRLPSILGVGTAASGLPSPGVTCPTQAAYALSKCLCGECSSVPGWQENTPAKPPLFPPVDNSITGKLTAIIRTHSEKRQIKPSPLPLDFQPYLFLLSLEKRRRNVSLSRWWKALDKNACYTALWVTAWFVRDTTMK